MASTENKDSFDIVVLKFADSKIPVFKEERNKNYITCGEKNDYPEYLIYQYNKSGKHRAIINGKAKYILGSGLEGTGAWADTEIDGVVTPAETVNFDGETMYDILQKSIKDIEIHGGFRWFVTADKAGRIAEIKHVDFYKIRTAKPKDIIDEKTKKKTGETGQGYYYKEKWIKDNGWENRTEEEIFYPEFTGKPTEDQKQLTGTYIFAYNEYGPGTDYYPLPEYIGCANYIDIDIEVSKFHLSAIRNGMMPSKMIQFFTGEPNDEKKKEIEQRFAKKFAGSENAGKFVLVFNPSGDKQKAVDVTDLSANELDKQFDLLSKTVQQEIFTGHQVVSPMLFGIKTEGQLGGSTELRIAYEIFINTYAKPKQCSLEKVVNSFGKLMNKGTGYKFKQLDPVGMVLDIKDFTDILPKEFVLEKLGVPKQYITPALPAPGQTAVLGEPTIPVVPGQPLPTATAPVEHSDVNENIKNLSTKQHQQVMRIIRQHAKGTMTPEVAKTLLRTGYGFTEDEINVMLGIDEGEVQMVKHVSLSQHMQNEIDEIVKPVIKLNFIEDKKVLSKRISYPVVNKDGEIVNAKVSVGRVQSKIKEQMQGLEQQLNELYAN